MIIPLYSMVVEKGYKTMKEMRLAMRDVEMDLPDEFGGYILTGATCYTTIPSCKMAVYATVSFIYTQFISTLCVWCLMLQQHHSVTQLISKLTCTLVNCMLNQGATENIQHVVLNKHSLHCSINIIPNIRSGQSLNPLLRPSKLIILNLRPQIV